MARALAISVCAQAVLDYDKYLDSHAAQARTDAPPPHLAPRRSRHHLAWTLSPSQVAEQASSAANGTFSGLGVLGLDGGSNRAAGGWDEAPAEIARPARTCGSLGMGVGAVRAWSRLDLGLISA